MSIFTAIDGQKADREELKKLGFGTESDFDRDLEWHNRFGPLEKGEEPYSSFNYVGFTFNRQNDVLIVFPKHYVVNDPERDARQLIRVIQTHTQRNPGLYFGSLRDREYKSNYPFADFFAIYEYYKKYGLYFEDKQIVGASPSGQINWKDSIRLSRKYLVDDSLIMYPYYYRRKIPFSSFLTECMSYAIDYTVDRFGFLLRLNPTGRFAHPEDAFLLQKGRIVSRLKELRGIVFKDNVRSLVDHLIGFYLQANNGGNYYFKHYGFNLIWEEAVRDYIDAHYLGVENNAVKFSLEPTVHAQFEFKKKYYPNLAIPGQYIQPDYYLSGTDSQVLLDAKYYQSVSQLDYKQVVYGLLLSHIREFPDGPRLFQRTTLALLLPGEERDTKIHFQMDPKFSREYSDLIIQEEYLASRDVLGFYAAN